MINVEYNQLDPLLRASGYPDGDVNCDTGYSPYPGNINQVSYICSLLVSGSTPRCANAIEKQKKRIQFSVQKLLCSVLTYLHHLDS